jgi:MFS family permease
MYYGPFLMQQAGFDDAKSQSILATMPLAVANFLGTIVAVVCIDRIGRRGVLLWTLPFLVGVLGTLSISYGSDAGLRWVIFTCMIMYVAIFAVGFGPTPWTVNAEIYDLHLRGTANSLATTANWTSCLVVSMFVLLLASTRGGVIALWLIFAFWGVISWGWVYTRLPETKGRTLEEIKFLFEKDSKLS